MRLLLFALPCLSVTLLAQSAAPPQEQKDFFESRIRPVLAQQCFACHTNSQMGGLRLDSREGMLKGGKSGPAVVPGDAEKSLLVSAVRQTGDLKMPKYGRLTEAQVADLTSWVKDGAIWPVALATQNYAIRPDQKNFWSFQPLAKPAVPKVKDAAWPLSDIDRFVLAKLEQEGMKPSPMADRRTLIRRVTYDLTGLTPSYEEVKEFESDKSPNAYEKLVDRLLASPHYGEMWARHWLDVVRFAEDDYRIAQKDMHEEKYKFGYTYRDWMIQAVNSDMSYDTMVKAQLAADLMDDKVRDKMIPALGMNGLGVWQFNDNPPPIERAEEWHDKTDTTTKALLGLTVGCARCHDHKYDPIPQKDYYRIAGMFASTSYHAYPLVGKDIVDEYDSKKKELDEREKQLKDFQDQLSELTARVLFSQTEKYMVGAWKFGSKKGNTIESIADQERLDPEILARWVAFLRKKPVNYSYLADWQKMLASGGSADEASTLAHNFYLKVVEIDKQHAKIKEEDQALLAKLKEGEEKFDVMPNGIKRKLNTHQIDLKAMDREASYLYKDMFETDVPEVPSQNPEDNRKPGLLKITDYALQRRLSPEFANYIDKMKADNEAFKKAMPKEYPTASGLADNKEATDLKIFMRGDPYTFGEDAPRAFLTIFSDGEPKPFKKGSGRMEFAEDVLRQPLAMRVITNRIWRWNMGSGIVDTANNFGFAGDRPSNPALLEYLTNRFLADGMSWKKLTKEIVMSRTYQLSSAPQEANLAKDADNRFYWRANRRRLEAEGIWDGLLTASGKLDLTKVGGPSEELEANMTRRGMYGRISRVFPNDFQVLFDLPTPTLSAEKRYTTNVALQRLFFLNNDFVHDQASALAARLKDAGDDSAQVKIAFEIVYQRDPSADETAVCLSLLHQPVAAPDGGAVPTPVRTAGSLTAKPDMVLVTDSMTVKPKDEPAAKSRKARKGESPLEALCWALLSSNEFLYLN